MGDSFLYSKFEINYFIYNKVLIFKRNRLMYLTSVLKYIRGCLCTYVHTNILNIYMHYQT